MGFGYCIQTEWPCGYLLMSRGSGAAMQLAVVSRARQRQVWQLGRIETRGAPDTR